MARQWKRIGSVAAAFLVFLIVFSSYSYLHPDSGLRNSLDLNGEQQQQHEQTEPYRSQVEQQPEKPNNEAHAVEPAYAPPAAPERPQHGNGEPDAPPPQSEQKDETPATEDAGTPPAPEKPAEINKVLSDTITALTEAATSSATAPAKAIVMGKLTTEDTDWVASELSDWQHAIYIVDLPSNATSPTGLKTKINKAKEAMPYLTYLVENYGSNMPDVMVFLHAHRLGYPAAWHNDAKNHDAVEMMHSLRLDTVKERGYVNLRCIQEPGCPAEILPWRSPPDPGKLPEQIYPFVYADFFNKSLAEARLEIETVATPCCAQFAVSREQVLKKPRSEYERYRRYLEETEYSDDDIGRVLEYMWHIIFGREPVHCDNTRDCWCKVYGRCDPRHGWG